MFYKDTNIVRAISVHAGARKISLFQRSKADMRAGIGFIWVRARNRQNEGAGATRGYEVANPSLGARCRHLLENLNKM